jgi:WD40 repeat protein
VRLSEEKQLTFLAGPNVNWPIWSPDGKFLVYTIFGMGSFLMETGKPWSKQTPAELPAWSVGGELFSAWSWSPDGRKLAGFLQRADGSYAGMVLYDVASHSYEKLTDSGIEPVWMNDSQRLLFNQDGRIHLVDSQTKRAHEVLSIAPAAIARRGFAQGRGDRTIYFGVAHTQADRMAPHVRMSGVRPGAQAPLKRDHDAIRSAGQSMQGSRASGAWTGHRPILLVKVFHQQHFIAFFVVDQFVGNLAGHENTEAAGTHPTLTAHFDMPERIVRRTGNGGMRQIPE